LRTDHQTLRLTIAANDSVVRASDGWNSFVEEHWVGSLQPVVPDTSFWSIVAGSRPTAMYDLLLETARSGHSIGIDVWAAAREATTKVELSVAPCDALGHVELTLRSLGRRRHQPLAIFEKMAERTADEVDVCSFCLSVRSFGWQEVERALRQLRFPFVGPQPQIVPRVCDQCERTISTSCAPFRLGAGNGLA
jgi:hypothetical protein